MVLFAA